MSKKTAIVYARVSSERQAGEDRVSIDQQLETCHKLCATIDADVAGVYVDKERYRKTRSPHKGKVVEPSGKYDDRPGLLQVLERVEVGDIDMVVVFDASRIGRHLRVLGTLSNSLDIARQSRNDQGEVQIWEAAKHTMLSGVMLGLMITIAQEDNESRQRRMVMGIEGTLKQGRWPTVYQRTGYKSRKEPGKRGHIIELGDPAEVQMIRDIFNWADKGEGTNKIGRRLRKRGIKMDERNVSKILSTPAYKGVLTYTFKNGKSFTLSIPPIVTPEQWERVQAQKKTNTRFCQRNTKGVFLAQHIAYCGQCRRAMTAHTNRYNNRRRASGEKIRYERKNPITSYICNRGSMEPHAKNRYPGSPIDALIWRTLADAINQNPEEIIGQTIAKVKALQVEGNSVTGRIAQYQKDLRDLDTQELAYNRQLARGKLNEENYDILVNEVNATRTAIQSELAELISLRDETEKTKNTLDYARNLLTEFGRRITEIDLSEDEMAALPRPARIEILTRRQQLVRALVDRVDFYPNKLVITGTIGSKTVQIDCMSLG